MLTILTDKIWFPPVTESLQDGLLAIGGDLSTERLLLAYQLGIFPWFNEEEELPLWWSPNPRFVLFPEKLKVHKSMKAVLNNGLWRFTINKDFEQVISNCAKIKRTNQQGTWIGNEMKEAYIKLHQQGYAHSAEVWENNELIGGLYGVKINQVFCGESMFAQKPNASKFAFINYVQQLKNEGIKLIDCQTHTTHLESLGAEFIDRDLFLKMLR